jgi:hypothetical protein
MRQKQLRSFYEQLSHIYNNLEDQRSQLDLRQDFTVIQNFQRTMQTKDIA